MQIDPSMSLDFPNSMPAPTPGISPTAAMGPSAASPEAILQNLLQYTGGDPARLADLLIQLLTMLTGEGQGGPEMAPQGPMDPSMMGGPSQAPPMV